MAGAVDGDHVWKRLCGDWHWCWSRNSDGEGDGEQDGENAVDSGAEGDASLGASHAGRRESASGGEPLASAHNEPAAAVRKQWTKSTVTTKMEVAMERASWMMGGAEPKMARAQGRRPETARARGRRPRSPLTEARRGAEPEVKL